MPRDALTAGASIPPAVRPLSASPAGRQHRILSGALSAVVTEVGASLRGLWSEDRAILDGYPEDAICSGSRGLPLLPWPNRIEDGRYRFGGETHQLPIDEPGRWTALHGLTRWLRWRTLEHEAARVTLGLDLPPRPGYPFSLDLAVTYELGAGGLTVRIVATNAGGTPLPFGAGHHPYVLPRGRLDDAVVRVRSGACLAHGDRGLPGAPSQVGGTPYDLRDGRRIAGLRFAHCYRLDRDRDGYARVEFDGVTMWMDERFRWVLLYTGDELPDPAARRRSLAIEPMTCPANAFRTGRDLIVLAPAETLTLRWGLVPRSHR